MFQCHCVSYTRNTSTSSWSVMVTTPSRPSSSSSSSLNRWMDGWLDWFGWLAGWLAHTHTLASSFGYTKCGPRSVSSTSPFPVRRAVSYLYSLPSSCHSRIILAHTHTHKGDWEREREREKDRHNNRPSPSAPITPSLQLHTRTQNDCMQLCNCAVPTTRTVDGYRLFIRIYTIGTLHSLESPTFAPHSLIQH